MYYWSALQRVGVALVAIAGLWIICMWAMGLWAQS